MTHLLSTLSKAFLFGLLWTTCSVVPVGAQDCNYTLVLEDTGGDGWGDALLTVHSQGLTGELITTEVTLETGFLEEVPFEVVHGGYYYIYFDTATTNNSEISFRVRSNRTTVAQFLWGPPDGILHVGTVNCFWADPLLCDCIGAFSVNGLGTQMNINPRSSIEPGDVYDLGSGNEGCLNGETYGIWMRYYVEFGDDILEMTFDLLAHEGPTDPQFDFAIWGPFEGDPVAQCSSLGQPLRCSAASGMGPTGMDMGAVDLSEGTEGDGWVRGIEVESFQSYLIYLESHAAFRVTYSLVFNGEMPITTDIISPSQGAATGIAIDHSGNSGMLSVSGQHEADHISAVQLFNTTGQLVRTSSVGQGGGSASVQLAIEDLSAGVYVVRAFDSASAVLGFARFVKE